MTKQSQKQMVKVQLPELEIDAELWKEFQELTYDRDDVIAMVAAEALEMIIDGLRRDPDFKARMENKIDIQIGKWAEERARA